MAEDLPDWGTMQEYPSSKGLGRVLGFCRHVLVLMEPWHSPRPPSRVWCLFEMFKGLDEVGGKADACPDGVQSLGDDTAVFFQGVSLGDRPRSLVLELLEVEAVDEARTTELLNWTAAWVHEVGAGKKQAGSTP